VADEPLWLTRVAVEAMHHDQLQEHGGLPGVRDENALESALARPRQRWAYEPESDLAALAAAYGFGLAKNHSFHDGNKRIAFVALAVFLGLNDLDLDVAEEEVVTVVLDLASGGLSEEALAEWLRRSLAR
jgi:death on curing protein